MTFAFFACLTVGLLSIGVGLLGIKTKAVTIPPLNISRQEKPFVYWYAVSFQIVLGVFCLLVAIDLVVPFGIGELISFLEN